MESGSLSQILSRLRRDREEDQSKGDERKRKPKSQPSSLRDPISGRGPTVVVEALPALMDTLQQEQLVATYTAQILMVRYARARAARCVH